MSCVTSDRSSKLSADFFICGRWARHLAWAGTQWKVESEVAQSCLTLWDPMDCSLPGSSVHGIFQARVLEWVATSFSRGSSQLRDRTWVSHIAGRLYPLSHQGSHWKTGFALPAKPLGKPSHSRHSIKVSSLVPSSCFISIVLVAESSSELSLLVWLKFPGRRSIIIYWTVSILFDIYLIYIFMLLKSKVDYDWFMLMLAETNMIL